MDLAKRRNQPNQHQGQTPTRGQANNHKQVEIAGKHTTGDKTGKRK